MTDPYTRMLMGENAVAVGVNFIMQETEKGMILIGQTNHPSANMLRFKAKKDRTHVLVLGDMILRPHLVLASDSFRGAGTTSLFKDGFTSHEKWLEGDIVLDAAGRLKELRG
jgi:hypothetical protein